MCLSVHYVPTFVYYFARLGRRAYTELQAEDHFRQAGT